MKSGNLPPFATVRLTIEDLTSNGESWTGRGKLKIPNAEGLLIQLLLRAKEAKGFPETPLMDLTFASAKHRVTNIPLPKAGVIGADSMSIRITNIDDTSMKVKMRFFSREGELLWVGDLMTEELPLMATGRLTSKNLATASGPGTRSVPPAFLRGAWERENFMGWGGDEDCHDGRLGSPSKIMEVLVIHSMVRLKPRSWRRLE